MAYEFQRQAIGTFQLNAYNSDKTLTLKNIGVNINNDQTGGVTIPAIINLLTVAGAQDIYEMTDSKRTLDDRVIET